jgi:predicted aspartyl protease
MVIKVNYSPLPGLEKTGILAPMIPVTFKNGRHEFSTIALVDSGAEAGIISTVIADKLNIKCS